MTTIQALKGQYQQVRKSLHAGSTENDYVSVPYKALCGLLDYVLQEGDAEKPTLECDGIAAARAVRARLEQTGDVAHVLRSALRQTMVFVGNQLKTISGTGERASKIAARTTRSGETRNTDICNIATPAVFASTSLTSATSPCSAAVPQRASAQTSSSALLLEATGLDQLSMQLCAVARRKAALKCKSSLAKRFAASAISEARAGTGECQVVQTEAKEFIDKLAHGDDRLAAQSSARAAVRFELRSQWEEQVALFRAACQHCGAATAELHSVELKHRDGTTASSSAIANLDSKTKALKNALGHTMQAFQRIHCEHDDAVIQLRMLRDAILDSNGSLQALRQDFQAEHDPGLVALMQCLQVAQNKCCELTGHIHAARQEVDDLTATMKALAPDAWRDRQHAQAVPGLTAQLEYAQKGILALQDVAQHAEALFSQPDKKHDLALFCIRHRMMTVAAQNMLMRLQVNEERDRTNSGCDVDRAALRGAPGCRSHVALQPRDCAAFRHGASGVHAQLLEEGGRLQHIAEQFHEDKHHATFMRTRAEQKRLHAWRLADLGANIAQSSGYQHGACGIASSLSFTPGVASLQSNVSPCMLEELEPTLGIGGPLAEDGLQGVLTEAAGDLGSGSGIWSEVADSSSKLGWNDAARITTRTAVAADVTSKNGGARAQECIDDAQIAAARQQSETENYRLEMLASQRVAKLHDDIGMGGASSRYADRRGALREMSELGDMRGKMRRTVLELQLSAAVPSQVGDAAHDIEFLTEVTSLATCCGLSVFANAARDEIVASASSLEQHIDRLESITIGMRSQAEALFDSVLDRDATQDKLAMLQERHASLTRELELAEESQETHVDKHNRVSARCAELDERRIAAKREVDAAQVVVQKMTENAVALPELRLQLRQGKEAARNLRAKQQDLLRSLRYHQNGKEGRAKQQNSAVEELEALVSKVRLNEVRAAEDQAALRQEEASLAAALTPLEDNCAKAARSAAARHMEASEQIAQEEEQVKALDSELMAHKEALKRQQEEWIAEQATWQRRKLDLEDQVRVVQRHLRTLRKSPLLAPSLPPEILPAAVAALGSSSVVPSGCAVVAAAVAVVDAVPSQGALLLPSLDIARVPRLGPDMSPRAKRQADSLGAEEPAGKVAKSGAEAPGDRRPSLGSENSGGFWTDDDGCSTAGGHAHNSGGSGIAPVSEVPNIAFCSAEVSALVAAAQREASPADLAAGFACATGLKDITQIEQGGGLDQESEPVVPGVGKPCDRLALPLESLL